MSHYASSAWNNPSGLVASLTATALMKETSGAGATEGTNLLTYTVPRTGLYRVTSYMKTTVISDAATSHESLAKVAYNDGSAIAAKAIGEDGLVPGGALECETLNDNHSQSMVVKAFLDTNIAISTFDTVVGAKTAGAGTYTLMFLIEAL